MSFLSKVELKRQLQALGIKVEGNYVKKCDIKKCLGQPIKTKSAQKVLQLMDDDWEYVDAVKKIAKEDSISIEQLEKELEPFI